MADAFNPFGTEVAQARRQQSPVARLLALGRFALFAALFYVLLKIFGRLGASFGQRLNRLYWSALFGNLQVAVAALAATAILARMDRRRFGFYGMGKSPCGRRFGFGAAVGFLALTLLLCTMRLLGVFYFGPPVQQGTAFAEFALVYLALFFAVALAEENLFRGYALVSLTDAITFWPAVLVLAVIFGWVHAGHAEESHRGLVFAGLFGVVLAYSFKRTGSLWFAFGLHAAWDFAESFVYGVPDSGVRVPGSWRAPVFDGPSSITGGSAGPEGSYLMMFVLIGLVLAVRALFPAEPADSEPY